MFSQEHGCPACSSYGLRGTTKEEGNLGWDAATATSRRGAPTTWRSASEQRASGCAAVAEPGEVLEQSLRGGFCGGVGAKGRGGEPPVLVGDTISKPCEEAFCYRGVSLQRCSLHGETLIDDGASELFSPFVRW